MPTIFELAQLTPQELIYQMFLPFILTLTVFFAVLQMIGMFSKKINMILSLGITVMITVSPFFATISILFSQFGAYTALAAFAIIFVIGIGAYTFRRSREYLGGMTSEEGELNRLYKQKSKLLEKIDRRGSSTDAEYDKLENLDKRIKFIEWKIRSHRR